jgi:hypothetical protein
VVGTATHALTLASFSGNSTRPFGVEWALIYAYDRLGLDQAAEIACSPSSRYLADGLAQYAGSFPSARAPRAKSRELLLLVARLLARLRLAFVLDVGGDAGSRGRRGKIPVLGRLLNPLNSSPGWV